MSSEARSIYIYGAGRIGLAVANLARKRGVEVVGLWNPRPLRARRAELAAGFAITVDETPIPASAELWLIAVPDDAIAATAERLASTAGPWPRAAAHCAGAHPATLLQPLADTGVACASWHPAMTFRGTASDVGALSDAVVALEGDAEAFEGFEAFCQVLGLRCVHVSAEHKPQYHAALVFAANGRVALDAASARLLRSVGIDARTAGSMLVPLINRTSSNLEVTLPEEALTGPVARGDVRTVREQLAALAAFPRLRRLYCALGWVALELVPDRVRGAGHEEVAALIAGDGEEE